jgi:glycosyltransferase involved in cell wall biosynthesis
MILAIDASRCRSGGSVNHLIGILEYLNPYNFNIKEIHIWSYDNLLLKLPNRSWLIKHNPTYLNKSIFLQLLWQFLIFKNELLKYNCNFLFTADASTLCNFKNQVVLSQDLLSYEPGTTKKFGFGISRLRLYLIRLIQNKAFQKANGVIFLTNYTSNLIQRSCGFLNKTIVIPHGFNPIFFNLNKTADWENEIICTYISNTEFYKHQWVVVEAIEKLRSKNYNIKLKLVGGGKGSAQRKLNNQISKSDPNGIFVFKYNFLTHNEIIELLSKSHIFIFASSCETFGITLLEGMATGLPIVCSNRSSLPEVLRNGGEYFDPENSVSIANAIETLINNKIYATELSIKSRSISAEYSWQRCSFETFSFINDCFIESQKNE